MPAYHSAFLQDTDVRIIGANASTSAFSLVANYHVGNFALLPLRTKTRGPAYTLPPLPAGVAELDLDPDHESYDILDETLTLFRANTLFRNFEIKGPADRVLIYGILWISDCLSKLKPTMTLRESEKAITTAALEQYALPGDPSFPLNALYQGPRDRGEAELLRGYIGQMRQELGSRLLARIYADGTGKPSKWWLSFTKRRFMGKSL
ncbi:actin-related protein 2/3 complex subunit 3 [Terfezia claveryi]|nr:actin-related protein 2/3 complex subunit 3 [Terfezia claveryi]